MTEVPLCVLLLFHCLFVYITNLCNSSMQIDSCPMILSANRFVNLQLCFTYTFALRFCPAPTAFPRSQSASNFSTSKFHFNMDNAVCRVRALSSSYHIVYRYLFSQQTDEETVHRA